MGQGKSAATLLSRGCPKASFECCSLTVSIKETYSIRNLFTFTSKVTANGKLAATLLCSLKQPWIWCVSVFIWSCVIARSFTTVITAPGCHLLLWQTVSSSSRFPGFLQTNTPNTHLPQRIRYLFTLSAKLIASSLHSSFSCQLTFRINVKCKPQSI